MNPLSAAHADDSVLMVILGLFQVQEGVDA